MNKINKTRNRLLAKIHLAKKSLALDDELYRDIIEDEFGVRTAAVLNQAQMIKLLRRFEEKGWAPKGCGLRVTGCGLKGKDQAEALKERIGQEVLHTDFDEHRLAGLVKKICGVDRLEWCGDAVRLKRLLAVIGDMIDKGRIQMEPRQTLKPEH